MDRQYKKNGVNDSNKDLISIVIPIYNTSDYLEECVESVCRQTYSNIEILLVDDGSTDGSAQIADELANKDNRIRVFHQDNRGLGNARNKGIREARGEFIGFVDSDDVIHPKMYEILHNNAGDEGCIPNIGICSLETDVHNNREWEVTTLSASVFFEELLLHKGDCSCCTKLFPKDFFDDGIFHDERLNEDFLLLVQKIEHQKFQQIRFINGKYYYFRIRPGSLTRSGYSKAIIDCIYNADYARDVAYRFYPQFIQIADRFLYVQYLQLYIRIPLHKMREGESNYIKVHNLAKKEIWRAMANPYLSSHEKRNFLALAFAPKICKYLFEKYYSIRDRK